ncbi:MAG TPA: hypothetical protein VGH35_09805 [Gaiellaceae bacterium]|jgi:hypothetical protein
MALDEATERLYGVDLDEFGAERARLAKELRGEGRREEAAQLAKLRKPTIAAWILNQLVRRHRREVDLLLHAGHRLRQSQAGVVRGGERASFEQARQTEAEAVRVLGRDAEALLRSTRGAASDAVLDQVVRGLRAAAVSDEGREHLARGDFVRPPAEESGFDLLSGLVGELPERPPRAKQRQDDARRAKAALQEARRVLREAERGLRDAEADARRAESAARTAAERVEAARAEVERRKRATE